MSFQELYEKVNQLITAQKLQFMYTSLTEVIQTHLLLVHHQLKVHPYPPSMLSRCNPSTCQQPKYISSFVARAILGNDELILLLQNVDHDGLLQAVLDAYEAHTLAMLKIRDLLMIMDSKRDSTRQPLLNLGTTLFNEKVVQVSALPGLQAHRSTS